MSWKGPPEIHRPAQSTVRIKFGSCCLVGSRKPPRLAALQTYQAPASLPDHPHRELTPHHVRTHSQFKTTVSFSCYASHKDSVALGFFSNLRLYVRRLLFIPTLWSGAVHQILYITGCYIFLNMLSVVPGCYLDDYTVIFIVVPDEITTSSALDKGGL